MANVCNKCGNNLYGNKTKCPFCGESINSSRPISSKPKSTGSNLSSSSYQNDNTYSGYDGISTSGNYQKSNQSSRNSSSYDSGSGGWGLLGFCFPLIGIILYLVWQNDKPNNAKAALNGALIGIVIGFVVGLFQACASFAAY